MKVVKQVLVIFLLVILVGVLSLPTMADVPELINYQGRLLNNDGSSVLNGVYPMSFRIYDLESSGNLLWLEDQTVSVTEGIYHVLLGSETPTVGNLNAPLFSSDSRWLEIVVSGEVMSPRQRITSVAYSFKAAEADSVGGMLPTDIMPVGDALSCNGNDKVIGLSSTGNVICGDDIDTIASEAEIDSAVANNGYSTGAHTVDTNTNAATICADGYFLNGDGTCNPVPVDTTNADNITTGTLNTNLYDSYDDLASGGRLDNDDGADLMTQSQMDARYLRHDSLKTGYFYMTAASMAGSGNYDIQSGGSVSNYSGSTDYWVGHGSVNIPDGATITQLKLYAYNYDFYTEPTFTCSLHIKAFHAPDGNEMASVSETISFSDIVQGYHTSDIQPPGDVVDKNTWVYYLKASMDGSGGLGDGSFARHYGCQIQYTYTDPTP